MLQRISRYSAALAVASACLFSSLAAAADPILVELDTSEGSIILELDQEKAPKTVANFLDYVKSGHFDGTIFHRVIPEFMIQGGGFDASMQEKPTKPPIKNEGANGLKNDEYTVAMARTGDPHSATSQFFINTGKKNGFLDHRSPTTEGYGYAVFGKVFDGKEVVDKIEAKPTRSVPAPGGRGLLEDVPVETVTIKSAKIMSGAGK
ncbi:peptidylprolyl isomerase [Rubripirellula reticaptiva]|uniref:Peptidyl-prolyl cis-trans isomerase n=1 Tax=Rubripirellula reticaptiva TaxID=2528013 RepID=A0A5C6F4T6_9BACT|nr:peptidylprolyl isomerase [Rubripirellula reticaptiva]TWU55524.1 Peptidyl-prolyl cis-trans isomerase cyp18 [Rubripirellula reticaptiva]